MNLVIKSLYLTIMLIIFSDISLASFQNDEEGEFRQSLFSNNVLVEGVRSHDMATAAWEHQKMIREIARKYQGELPKAGPDGQVPTQNKMGFHWGYHPAVFTRVNKSLKGRENQELNLLEIGAGYGFDLMALLKKYKALKVTAVEMGVGQFNAMQQMCSTELSGAENDRLTSINKKFPDLGDLELLEGKFDIAVVSKVLHFYDLQQRLEFLTQLHSLMKPGGIVVMSCMSNHALTIVDWSTWMFGECIPRLSSIWPWMKMQKSLEWSRFLSPEGIEKPATEAGFHVEKNEYVGMVHEKSADQYWMFGGIRRKEAVLYTTLIKK